MLSGQEDPRTTKSQELCVSSATPQRPSGCTGQQSRACGCVPFRRPPLPPKQMLGFPLGRPSKPARKGDLQSIPVVLSFVGARSEALIFCWAHFGEAASRVSPQHGPHDKKHPGLVHPLRDLAHSSRVSGLESLGKTGLLVNKPLSDFWPIYSTGSDPVGSGDLCGNPLLSPWLEARDSSERTHSRAVCERQGTDSHVALLSAHLLDLESVGYIMSLCWF